MKVSKKTMIKAMLLGISSIVGLVNYASLYAVGKKIKSKLLKIISVVSPIALMFLFVILDSTGDDETLMINLITVFVSVLVIGATVLIIVNLKKYIYADMLYEYIDEFGIDLELLETIDPSECKLAMIVNSQVKSIAKELFSDKYYAVLVEIEACLNNITSKKVVKETLERKAEKEENLEKSIKPKVIEENINLPIGNCSVSGDEDNFKITIFSNDEKKYDFNVVDGRIVDCFKNGMKSKKVYEV